MAPADEDIGFKITYRPCGKPVYADVSWRGGEATFCKEHAKEAEQEGCEVDWPEEAE